MLLLYCLLHFSCKTVETYPNPDRPKWLGNSISTDAKSKEELTIITFNIEKSQKIDLAIQELQPSAGFQYPDILLLQEIDEHGVIAIADLFSLNYLYYPISVNRGNDKSFGNAILTKFNSTRIKAHTSSF